MCRAAILLALAGCGLELDPVTWAATRSVLAYDDCRLPCCAHDFDAGTATEFPDECYSGHAVVAQW